MKTVLLLATCLMSISWTLASTPAKPAKACGENEEYSDNAIICPPQSCESPYTDYWCEPRDPTPGCNCISEYLRNSTGHCIPSDECPQAPRCPLDHEVWGECSNNQPTCENRSPAEICPSECEEGCVCEPGYVRDGQWRCVPEDQCHTCPKDEKWVECELGVCVPKKCEEIGYPVPCPDIIGPCEGGCICNEGYVRNCAGICVKVSECPSCGGDRNATGGCGTYCKTCQNQRERYIACPKTCEYNGCDCKPGHIYDKVTKKCVLYKDCPYEGPKCGKRYLPLPCDTKKHEKWVECLVNVCIPKLCSDLGYPLNCSDKVDEADCCGGCICEAGYLRNKKGECVPVIECPSCGGDRNATMGCGNYCKNSCSDYKNTTKRCGFGCIQNSCKCREGYVRNELLKKCVLPTDCPLPCDDPNAERVSCATHCPPTCEKPEPDPCPYAACTKNGCQCKKGYILSKTNGKCIKIGECPDCACNGDPNARIKACPDLCAATCDNREPKPCDIPCYPVGCECRPGYIKTKRVSGTCVKPDQCPIKGSNTIAASCNANEVYLVNTNECQRSCKDLKPGAPPSICPPTSGCFCKPDYVRLGPNGSGPCVPKERCQ